MKKIKKIIKITFITSIILCVMAVISGIIFYNATTYSVNLDTSKLEETKTVNNLQIFDTNKNLINLSSENYIPISKLSTKTKNAFICAEDKRFYSHSGVDYIRMAGALISNIKAHSFSQGASTISQQLVKNTQLSSEKTIKRKLKEIKLTKQLENKYSKDDILEMYLNNIYFGNGCYGIENASKHYFNKSASKLTLAESALLAGTINAPSFYDIQNNQTKALERRNLILDLMHSYGKITSDEHKKAKDEPINLNLTKLSNTNFLWGEIIDEACKILKTNEMQLKNSKLKIYTYVDLNLQNQIYEKIKQNYSHLESNPQTATMVVDNKTNGIVAITGSNQTLKSKKQPGSIIKPIVVYAPAFENNVISPATKILDEKININGYSPDNADKRFHGYVSVREALKNSYNVPAVKILNETGILKSQEFAKKLGIDFEKEDNNLAIALGGFTKGTTIQNLCDAYTSIANNGAFSKSKYISKITLNNNYIYEAKNTKTKAFSSSTAYLLTSILKDATKSGTARRLNSFNYDIASKTGTVGKANSTKNIEAYNATYTSSHTIISYVGGTTMPENINGATYPTMMTKDILNILYKNNTPKNFETPNSIVIKNIDKNEYKNNKVVETDNINNSIKEIFAKNNLPNKNENSLSLKLEAFNFENKKPLLCFFVSPNYDYKLIRTNKNNYEIITELNNLKEYKIYKFEDKSAKINGIYEYFVEICEKSTNKTYKTNTIKLKSF